MIDLKCKKCGGTLVFEPGATVAECEYCMSRVTLPRLDNDKKKNMIERAEYFRRQFEYDKAISIYEQILHEDSSDAEIYWLMVLCRFGIEYVKDPSSGRRIPTINRVQYTFVTSDDNYLSALRYADSAQKAQYTEDALEIEKIQKEILKISKEEKPFDIFICYKETDNAGRRTMDSVLANDMYHQLTHEGYKVFFSRITLEDKIGSAYEPVIFAALNSAKIMIAVGTCKEHYEAVWVKNEWKRYMALIHAGAKKTLIPAYRDMNPYDLPEDFAYLQAQDMGKLGFMQDLLHGIRKILSENETPAAKQEPVQKTEASPSTENLIRRAFLLLEDGESKKAEELSEQVLNIDCENAQAYLVKLLIDMGVKTQKQLSDCETSFEENPNYKKIMRFGNAELIESLKKILQDINEEIIEKQYEYEILDDGTVKIKKYIATESSVIIPEKIEKRIVTTIGEKAFEDCKSLTSITISDSVSSMGKNPFCYCSKIISIKVSPENKYFETINGILFEKSTKTLVCYPCGYNASSYVIPQGILAIGDYAFYSCTSLTSITIPDSVTSIGDSAFFSCDSLTSVTIPDSVSSMGKNPFRYCSKIISIKVSPENKYFETINGILFEKSTKTLVCYPCGYNASSYVIPQGILAIGDFAFDGCTSLTSITIPDSVTSIGDFAFSGCHSLTSVTIPDSVTSIGNYAFFSCGSLTSVTIPDSVTSIGNYAFFSCGSLTSVTIPDSVTSIGSYAFSYCKFLTSVTIPDSVTSIGDYAFSWCESLTSVTIPDSVTSIGDHAFFGCNEIMLVVAKGSYAERWATKNRVQYSYPEDDFEYTLSQDGTTIITKYIGNAETLIIPASIDGHSVTSIGDSAFSGCTSLTSVTIPDSVTSIGNYAFSDCTSLTSVTIPDSVTSIGNCAFKECRSLTSVTIPDSVTSIGDLAFYYCRSLTSVTIPDSVTSIGEAAFEACKSLTSVTIPDSVTSIGSFAFLSCDSLTSVTIPDSVTSIGDGAFSGCTSLTSVTIPDSVTSIGGYAFQYCTSLTSVTIPDSVTSIGDFAFKECRSLTSVTIPDSVTSIGDGAFEACKSLTSVTIPKSVTSIGNSAFSDCDSLTVTLLGKVKNIGDDAFKGCKVKKKYGLFGF